MKTKLYVTKKIDNSYVAVFFKKVTLTLKKPGYRGMCTLELSKGKEKVN